MEQLVFFNKIFRKKDMKLKKILFLIASLGLLSASTKPVFAGEVLIAHAEVKKIVTVKYKPTKIEKVTEKKVLPNGDVKKIISNLKLCKKVRSVKTIDGKLLKKNVTRNVKCPNDLSLYNQKKIFSNHKSSVESVNHTHYYPSTKTTKSIAPSQKVIDDNSCKEGSIIGGLLGAGLTMSATRGKDRWWAVPAGGTAGALIGCQIDGG